MSGGSRQKSLAAQSEKNHTRDYACFGFDEQ